MPKLPSKMSIPQRPLPNDHPDFHIIEEICEAIRRRAGTKGWDDFVVELPQRLRQAIDEVIDTPRTGRFELSETEKTEKTYIGTKVEILVRDYLGFPKGLAGVLDLEVEGRSVDVKNTVTGNWMIPAEALGHPCILIHEDEQRSECSFGVIIAKPEYLTQGANRDGKVSVSASGKNNIHWLLFKHKYPDNFWKQVPSSHRKWIVTPRGGTKRLERLFLMLLERPIPRRIVEAVASQSDFMKRIRANGGVRDILGPKGVAVLNGTTDNELLKKLAHPEINSDEFISVAVKDSGAREVLKSSGRHSYVTAIFNSEILEDLPK
ncbi:NaeI family type II restriction endonuclease [Gluconobacter sp. OJA]|uniref:NaeI family type II restriction endonuclease n=1 Tax=Gluconobacter sp. OJA TaxID=3145197 RepID=UPI0031F7919F